MKYLVLGVWQNAGMLQIATLSKEMYVLNEPEDEAELIITELCKDALPRESLHEVFVFKSAVNWTSAPELAAHWNAEDGLFGEDSGEDEDEGEDDQG